MHCRDISKLNVVCHFLSPFSWIAVGLQKGNKLRWEGQGLQCLEQKGRLFLFELLKDSKHFAWT